jgi:hypothetical protein
MLKNVKNHIMGISMTIDFEVIDLVEGIIAYISRYIMGLTYEINCLP